MGGLFALWGGCSPSALGCFDGPLAALLPSLAGEQHFSALGLIEGGPHLEGFEMSDMEWDLAPSSLGKVPRIFGTRDNRHGDAKSALNAQYDDDGRRCFASSGIVTGCP